MKNSDTEPHTIVDRPVHRPHCSHTDKTGGGGSLRDVTQLGFSNICGIFLYNFLF